MTVVIVESPAKAKTINKYLGKEYTVLASYGHVRDLRNKKGSVCPDQNFKMIWEIDSYKQKQLKAIADTLHNEKKLILATDPDREGEAISWHLLEILSKRKVIKKDTVIERVVFNAVTKNAILSAMKSPRKIDMDLVDAYLARRALDYLVGFNLSSILWNILPGSRSAGRVQSVSLRLIVEREMEIESFLPEEYWSLKILFETEKKESFLSRLSIFKNKKIEKKSIKNKSQVDEIVSIVSKGNYTIKKISSSDKIRNPYPPFMTSTLQQEASRKLGLGTKQTMIAAQKLYESGLITYMRTDGIDMDQNAIEENRKEILKKYGKNFVPENFRTYKNKAKNSQEAHECIRPTNASNMPGKVAISDKDQERLYELIWKRTISSQMKSALFKTTNIEISNENEEIIFKTSGQVLIFEGFLKVYGLLVEDEKEDEGNSILPEMKVGQNLITNDIKVEQHFTQPPPRYHEATLVKKMEELGIGRPSTYSSTIMTLLDREYIRKEKNRLFPEDRGRLVTIFLKNYFKKYLAYDYTAELEGKLDKVSAGEENWKKVLKEFWDEFTVSISETSELRTREVLDTLNDVLAPHIFPEKNDGTDPRKCNLCDDGKLSLKPSKIGGGFIGCSNYPECKYTRPMSSLENEQSISPSNEIGKNEDNKSIFIKKGRFGPYLEIENDNKNTKAKTVSIPKGLDLEKINLEFAKKLLSLPKEIGTHPEDNLPIEIAIGRYGPYIKHSNTFANVKDVEELFQIGMNRAVEILAEKKLKKGSFSSSKSIRDLEEHPEGGVIQVMDGKYGPYVKWKKINATIPKSVSPETLDLQLAIELIKAKMNSKKLKK